jgi:hypothetical protein
LNPKTHPKGKFFDGSNNLPQPSLPTTLWVSDAPSVRTPPQKIKGIFFLVVCTLLSCWTWGKMPLKAF